MSDVTQILDSLEADDSLAAEQLLLLVYDELRRLAKKKLAHERPGQTLTATGLVHEAWLRLVDSKSPPEWESKGHFFAAAAEAMRRILIERARKKAALKRGGDRKQVPLEAVVLDLELPSDDFLDFNEALSRLEEVDPDSARLVKLRVFAGLSVEEAAASLGIAVRTAYRDWSFAQAWLFRAVSDQDD